jgi:hypothetical protein
LPLRGIEPRLHGHPAGSLVVIPTDIFVTPNNMMISDELKRIWKESVVAYSRRAQGNPRIYVRIVGVQAEIRTERPLYASPDLYERAWFFETLDHICSSSRRYITEKTWVEAV